MKIAPYALCLASTLIATPAFAFPKFLGTFTTHYANAGIDVSDLASNESCATCHVNPAGGGRRNGYGSDFAAAGASDSAFAAIDAKDSDGDTFTNIEEIFAQKAPGSSDDVPAGRIALVLTDKGLSVTSPVACETLELIATGFTFDGGKSTLTLSKVDAKALSTLALKGLKGTVLARCAKESLAGSVASL